MNKMKVILSLTIVSIAVPFLCAFESAPSLPFIPSTYSGHEEITRQALNKTIQRLHDFDVSGILKIQDFVSDLGPASKGLFGSKSHNMLVHGNFATDFPTQTQVLDLGQFWKIGSFSWAENPKIQHLHFLRDYKDDLTLISARQTCYQARDAIKYVTQEAVKYWDSGEKTKALFLMGHATHIIQDSFSRAHAVRGNGPNNYNLADICFYGPKMGRKINDPSGREQTTCYHNAMDTRDSIWNLSAGERRLTEVEWPLEKSIQCDKGNGYPETEEQKENCLKHEARLARVATEKYLFLVLAHLNAPSRKEMPDFISSLDTRLFEGPTGQADLDQKMPGGIMRCESLSDQEIRGIDVDYTGG